VDPTRYELLVRWIIRLFSKEKLLSYQHSVKVIQSENKKRNRTSGKKSCIIKKKKKVRNLVFLINIFF
jgi:hypothetical protein